MKPLTNCLAVAPFAALAIAAAAQVTTSQYDNRCNGATLNEKILTPQNLNPNQFGKLGAFKVHGAVYAQPLFMPAVDIPGKGKHDVSVLLPPSTIACTRSTRFVPAIRHCGRLVGSTKRAARCPSPKTTPRVRLFASKSASPPRP